MTSTLLPQLPRGSYRWQYISNNIDLTSADTGVTQRVSKLGDKFEVSTTFRVRGEQGIGLMAVLNSNKSKKVRLPFPQTMDIGSPGNAVKVNGAASGTTINLKGFTPNYKLKAGQFISVVHNAKRYLHQVVFDVTANGSGVAQTVIIAPMLRAPVIGDETVEVAEPTIEGYLTTNTNEWVSDFIKSVAVTVTVREAE